MTETTKVPLIFSKMAAVMEKIGAIGKGQRNAQQGFNFRSIDDAYNHCHPLLAENSIFCGLEVLSEREEERTTAKGVRLIYRILKVKHSFYTTDGSSVSSITIGEAMDSGDKAANKAMAVAHKYCLIQTFAIPTEESLDPDRTTYDVKPKPKATQKDVDTAVVSTPSTQEVTYNAPKFEGDNVICSKCGSKMYVTKFPDKNGNLFYYCSNKKEGCKHKLWPEVPLKAPAVQQEPVATQPTELPPETNTDDIPF